MKRKKIQCYGIYTGMFIILCTVTFLPFIIEGKSFIWAAGVEDGLSQHFSALAYYGELLRKLAGSFLAGEFKIPMWEMSIGYGADIIQTLNYYAIGDPLNLLYGFVPEKYTEIMYHFMIILRMYLAGIIFIMYSRKMKKRDEGAIIGAVVYVFCGFTLRLGLRHPFFLNPMIYFPLLCLGIEKIFKKEKPFLFVLAVCLSALSNYYFLYMLTIFSVIYAWIRFYKYEKGQGIKRFFQVVGKFAGYYMLGIAMSAVILLPSVIGFLGNGRNGVGVDWMTLIIYPVKYYVLFIENSVGYGNIGNNTNAGFLPIAGIAVLFTLFSDRMKHRKYKMAYITSLIALAFPIFGFAFNGFSYASNRWSFVLSFIVALLTAEMYPRFFIMTKRQKIGIAAGILLYQLLAIGAGLYDSKMFESRGVYTACGLLWIFYFCFLWFQKKGYNGRMTITKVVIGCLLIISAGTHGYYRFSEKQSAYTKQFLDQNTALKRLCPKEIEMLKSVKDSSLYRVHAEEFKYKNYGLINDLNTISGYYSITAGDVTKTVNSYETLGMQYADKYHGLDQRTGLMSLAGVKYVTISGNGFIDEKNRSKGDVPYGFKKLKTNGRITLYENPYCLPMAYGYESFITKNQYNALNGVGREQAMLGNIVLEKEPKRTKLKHEKVYNQPKVSTIPLSEKRISSPKGEKYAEITVPVNSKKEIYLYFKNLEYDDSKVSTENVFLSGKKSTKGIIIDQKELSKKIFIQSKFSPYYFGRKDYMVKVDCRGTKGKEQIRMRFLSRGNYKFDNFYLVVADKKQTIEKINSLKKHGLKNILYDGNTFSGDVQGEKDQAVCIAIPYSRGWEATVDGRKTPIQKANGMFMGVMVDKGNHHIELHYTTPGLWTGMWISIAGWIIFVGMVVKMTILSDSLRRKEV